MPSSPSFQTSESLFSREKSLQILTKVRLKESSFGFRVHRDFGHVNTRLEYFFFSGLPNTFPLENIVLV